MDDLRDAVQFDHVGCKFRDGRNNRRSLIRSYRNNKCFESADCIIMDCDNTSTDPTRDLNESDWKTPENVADVFHDVEFYRVYSRNHMKEKDGRAARPKFHIYFPLAQPITNFQALANLKERVYRHFKSFDPNALKVTQFMFGVENPDVEHVAGSVKIDQWIETDNRLPDVIPEGTRNKTMYGHAVKLITRLGDTAEAKTSFLKAAERCFPPLEDSELETIWRSAQNFFHTKVENDPGYLTPEEFEFGGQKKGFTLDKMRRLLHKMDLRLRFNVISGKTEIAGLTGIKDGDAANVLPGRIRSYMSEKGIHCSRADMDDYLTNILAENHFNPVEAMLTKTTWDGEDRVAELLEIIGIIEERERTLVQKWLHQCIAMALNEEKHPYGADGVLVLQGEQGIGKTLLCSRLAMQPDWFAEGVSIDMGNKDSIIQATSCWIAELGELDSTLKREQSALKAFLTAKSDTYRPPYGRAAVTRVRRTSFCATVNPLEFLNDETGSRRFWVVSPNIDLDRVLKLNELWLHQMWTQVYETMYKENPQGFRLERQEQKSLATANKVYSKPLAGEIELRDKLNFDAPEAQWRWKTVSEIAEVAGRNFSSIQIGKVLTKMGLKMKNSHNRKLYYVPPTDLAGEFHNYEEDDKINRNI